MTQHMVAIVKREGANKETAILDRAARYADLLTEHEVAVEAGSTTKTWKTAGDGHERHSHAAMEGGTIPIDGYFEVGGERLFLPGDPSASLEETANCRCYIAYGMQQRAGEIKTPTAG